MILPQPFKDDLVFSFVATPHGRDNWEEDGEIAEMAFFGADELPEPMTERARIRIRDAFAGQRGVVRVFDSDS